MSEANDSNVAATQGNPVEAAKDVVPVAKPVREKRKRPRVQFGPPTGEVEHVEQVTVRIVARDGAGAGA